MHRSTLLILLSGLAMAVTACQGEETGSGQGAPPTSIATTDAARGDLDSTSAMPPDGAEASASSEATPGPLARAKVHWRNSHLVPASAPVSVGDAVVLYTVEGQRLHITSVDARDGEVLWSEVATASVRPAGQSLTVEAVDGVVAYLSPAAREPARAPAYVILRDPVTGEEVRRSATALSHADLPSPCPHDDALTCVTVPVNGEWDLQVLTPGGAFATPPATSGGVPGWMGIGPLGLSRVGGDGTRVGRVVDGRLAWEIDTTEVFGPGQSTDTGWWFEGFGDDSVLVGTIGLGIAPPSDGDTWDMTQSLALGLDAGSGETLWRAAATTTFCDVDITGKPEDPLLGCEWNGGVAEAVDGALVYHDVNIDLVRLDPLTGDRLWEVELGATSADGKPALPDLQLVNATTIAVHGSDGLRVIDLETGEHRPATTADRHWVQDYDLLDLLSQGDEPVQVTASGRYRLLDRAGSAAEGAPWPLPTTIGAERDGGATLVVADPNGLTAYVEPGSAG